MSIVLPRLQQSGPIADERGLPTFAFHAAIDNIVAAIEQALNDISDNVAAIAAAQAAANAAQADATNALNQLIDIASDNKLTPVEKFTVIKDYDVIISEQTDIDAKATTYGIGTEKTNYDNAVSALTTYLATLTTPVLWSNTSGNTDIIGTTFRSKFEDVYTTKQLLLNKLHNSAKTLADSAQTTATTAVTNAATAQTTADNVNKNDKNTASATVPTSILTATDAGTDVTIGVLAHDRQYGDGTSVSLNAIASAVTGLAYSTQYALYYDDTGYTGGTKTYHATTTLKTAQPEKVNGRHYCGQITTPAAAGAPVTDGGARSPSGSGPYP